jgi:hypothetical protein
MIRSSIISFFVKICLQFTCILSYFRKKIGGYLTSSNLELVILVIPGCCKKMVYQYIVVAKIKWRVLIILGYWTPDLLNCNQTCYAIESFKKWLFKFSSLSEIELMLPICKLYVADYIMFANRQHRFYLR